MNENMNKFFYFFLDLQDGICGLSQKQPFCDGSHKDDEQERKPIEYTAISDRFISFCTCKETDLPPLCDGSHRKNKETGK